MNTLQEAQQHVKEGVGRKGGCTCPCCGQHCEEYRFSVSASLARQLYTLYKARTPLHLKDFITGRAGGYNTFILKNFGLIQQEASDKPKPFNRSGIWSITLRGCQWIEGIVTLPRYVFIFDEKAAGFSTEVWSWRDALQGKWSPEDARAETPGLGGT